MIKYLINKAKKTPYFHLDGYMNRWWLVPHTKELGDGTGPVTWSRPLAKLIQKLGFAVRIHEILRSDTDRCPHDHPWPYLTIILKGGYYEEQYSSDGEHVRTVWCGPGSILFRRAGSWHRVTLATKQCTTLFITGKYRWGWGFLVNGKKVPYKEHLG